MVPHRRRRRRVVQQSVGGTYKLTIPRGPQGFGFTISGQAPCVVSHVASGGSADRAGLRVGLVLLAVESTYVAQAPHDVVAQLIARAPEAISLTVTADRDRDLSDTSDDERVRQRPRHPLRPRPKPPRSDVRNRLEPLGRRRSSDDCLSSHTPSHGGSPSKDPFLQLSCSGSGELYAVKYPGCNGASNILQGIRQQQLAQNELHLECRAVVSYLGTIVNPTPITNGSELNTVRKTIRKLRQEKRSLTQILMTVLPMSMNLKKINGTIAAEYARDRIVYVSCSSENDHRYFGLVTCSTHDSQDKEKVGPSHSCHVFTVDPKLVDHTTHVCKANDFKITCTLDPVTNHCLEFPSSSEYVVGVIRSMYSLNQNGFSSPGIENISKLALKSNSPGVGANFSRNNNRCLLRGVRYGRRFNCNDGNDYLNPVDNINPDFVSNSPQPSNHSEMTTASSNSDSGIGFHNDCQNIADKILVVDFGQQARHLLNGQVLPQQPCKNDARPRPLGIAGCYDMDSSFLSNTMPVVDGFAGRGQPLNHLDDLISRICDIQPHCSFNNANYPSPRKVGENKLKDTYNYNNVHYGNVPPFQNCKENCYENTTCRHYDQVYTENEGHYETIKPVLDLDSLSLENRFKGMDISDSTKTIQDCTDKTNGSESVDDMTVVSSKSHDYIHSGKTSMDDISMYSSRSHEYFSKKGNQIKKLQASIEDILMLGLVKNEKSTRNDENFLHPANVKLKSKKSRNLLSKTKTMFNGKLKTPEKRTRAFSASVSDVCGVQEADSEAIPMACSEPDLRDSSAHQSESEQSSPFRRWTTGAGTGSSYRHHDQRSMFNKENGDVKESTAGGVARWSLGLEHLLADRAGAAAFAAFLSKEFAAENIKFWWSCEQYKSVAESSRAAAAREIWSRHLAEGCPEPVNVDAPARRAAALSLEQAPSDLFHQAQKQIFNLMKFDSYPRFLRSDVHAECARADLRGENSPYALPNIAPLVPVTPTKLKKSASNVSERRRSGGSLLPWSRLRAVSRDREHQHINVEEKSQQESSDVVVTGVSGSCSLCRVVLPDGATSVVGVDSSVTVRRLVDRLLARRALNESCRAYDVMLVAAPNQQAVNIDLDSPSTILGGKSARVERRCVFRLELPTRRAVAVRCRAGKKLKHVLRPVINRYLPTLPTTANVQVMKDKELLSDDTRVQDIDGCRLQVYLDEDCYSVSSAPPSGEIEGDGEDIDDLALRLQEESPRSADLDTQSVSSEGSRVVRAALRAGASLHPHPQHHPPDFLENLRQTQRARLQSKPIATSPSRIPPPPLPPKPRAQTHKHITNGVSSAAGALV